MSVQNPLAEQAGWVGQTSMPTGVLVLTDPLLCIPHS